MLRIGTLLVALVASLTLASAGLAKGGGASCAQIIDFAVTQGSSADGQPTLTTSYTVDNECVDHENMSVAALDYSNSVDSFVGRAVTMLPYGSSTYTGNASIAAPGVTYTETLTVYAPNGKVAATRTVSVTIPAV